MIRIVIILLLIVWAVYRNTHPKCLGVRDGALRPCPWTPNCVNSKARNPLHRIEPLHAYSNDSISRLAKIIEAMPRAKIAVRTETYLHAEFTSPVFRFVDDVEFFHVPEENEVRLRSSARLGFSDLGVNRRRIERIREQYTQNSYQKN